MIGPVIDVVGSRQVDSGLSRTLKLRTNHKTTSHPRFSNKTPMTDDDIRYSVFHKASRTISKALL